MQNIGKRRCALWIFCLTVSLVIFSVPAGAAAGPPKEIVAEVNGTPITRQRFQIDYRQAVNDHARKGNPVNEVYLRDLRFRLIDYLVETELLVQDALGRGIQVSDKELDEAIAADQARFESEDQFQGYLRTRGTSLVEYRERRRRDLVIEKLVATHIAPDVVISDQDIADDYRQHNARYRVPERLHIRHISLRPPPDADEIQKSAVRDRIREIARQLSAGRDFAELAHQYSEDPSRQKGGDAGYVDAVRASQIFGERVLAVPTGQVSPPLETPTGYHLVTIEDRKPARVIPLEVVREEIRRALYRQRTTPPLMAYVQTLRAKAHIVIHE